MFTTLLVVLLVIGALWVIAVAGPRREDDFYDYLLNDEAENSDYQPED